MGRFAVRQADTMPVRSPLVPDPFVPYRCPGNRALSVVCRGDARAIRRYLEHTPFESAGDLFVVSVSDFSNSDKVAYMDAAIVPPIAFISSSTRTTTAPSRPGAIRGAIRRSTPRSRWPSRAAS